MVLYKGKNRWGLILLSVIFILTGIFVAFMHEHGGSRMYTNGALGFSLEVPSSWFGKYIALEGENSVTFYHSAIFKKYKKGGRFFSISREDGILSKEQVENTPWPTYFLMHANGYTYIMVTPSDMQTPTEGVLSILYEIQYDRMAKDVEEIRNSIKAIEPTNL